MSYHQWVAAVVAIYLVFTAMVAVRIWRDRRAERRLEWPVSITQRQMERYLVRYLARRGWRIALQASHAGKSLYRADRDEEAMFVLMLRDVSFFSRLMRSLRGQDPAILQRLAIILFDAPNAAMAASAAEAGISLMRHVELPAIVGRLQRVLPRNWAAEGGAPAATESMPSVPLGRITS